MHHRGRAFQLTSIDSVHGAATCLAFFAVMGVGATTTLAVPPRYIATAVAGLQHPCWPSDPLSFAPNHGVALAADGRVAGEANCGSTVGGSRPFVTALDGTVTELPHGSFNFTEPAAFLNNNRILMVGNWCPPVTGTCTTALAVAEANGSLSVLDSSSQVSTEVADSNELGWAVGWGGSNGNGWRMKPDGAIAALTVPKGSGLNASAISLQGVVSGSAYVSGVLRAIRWDAAGNAAILPAIEAGTACDGEGVAIDGSVVGRANGRAVWWNTPQTPSSLLPVGSASVATHLAGNPMGMDPLGISIFGTHQNGSRLFRATGANMWSDLGPIDASAQLTMLSVVAAPRPDFMVAQGFTVIYQPVALVWTLGDTLRRLDTLVINPPAGSASQPLMVVDANSSGTLLANLGFNGAPYLLTRLYDGDTNGDAFVNGLDLAQLLATWGPVAAGTRAAADFDGDQYVQGSDLAILLANWH